MQHVDVAILGAGAAGLMCAIEAGKAWATRASLSSTTPIGIGNKILISGGGHCNFTNLGTAAENFLSENPHFAKLRPRPLYSARLPRPCRPSTKSPTMRST